MASPVQENNIASSIETSLNQLRSYIVTKLVISGPLHGTISILLITLYGRECTRISNLIKLKDQEVEKTARLRREIGDLDGNITGLKESLPTKKIKYLL